MRTRTALSLVPLLAASVPALAADGEAPLAWHGHTTTSFTLADTSAKAADAGDESLGGGFANHALITAQATLAPDVTGTVTIYADAGDALSLSQSFIAWQPRERLSIEAGLSYGPIGLLPAEQPEFTTVNQSLIGYIDRYGSGPIGVSAVIEAHPTITVILGLYNGFFGDEVGNAGLDLRRAPAVDQGGPQKPSDWAWVADVTITEGDICLNGEFVYDAGAVTDRTDAAKAKAVIHLGLNALWTLGEGDEIGAEVIWQSNQPADGDRTLAAQGYITHACEMAGCPSRLSFQAQLLRTALADDAGTAQSLGVQAAMTFNPAPSDRMAITVEAGFARFNADATGDEAVTGYELSANLVLAF